MVAATTKAVMPAKAARNASGDNQFLVFTLAGEQFAVEVSRLLQIRSWGSVTPVPDAPDYVLGKTDLQGAKLMVVDLRKRLMLPCAPPTSRTLVIVLRFVCNGVSLPVGFTADASSGAQALVCDFDHPDSDNPDFGNSDSSNPDSSNPGPGQFGPAGRNFVRGITKAGTTQANGQRVVVLDTDSLIDQSVLAGEAARHVPNSRRVH